MGTSKPKQFIERSNHFLTVNDMIHNERELVPERRPSSFRETQRPDRLLHADDAVERAPGPAKSQILQFSNSAKACGQVADDTAAGLVSDDLRSTNGKERLDQVEAVVNVPSDWRLSTLRHGVVGFRRHQLEERIEFAEQPV